MIAVVGAGPAGLAAAWRTAAAGHQVVVIERAPAVGGMAGSFEVAGLRVDHGSHRLHAATPAPILAALRGLLGSDLQVRPRHGRIRLLDRWVAFPLRTGDLVRRTPPAFAVRAAADALTGPLRRPRADTFAEVVRAGLGPAVLDAFYEPYARKLWDTPPTGLAGELARRRVSASSPADIVRRLARGTRPEGRTFLYPRRGFGAIPEALAEAARGAGATIRLGCRLDALCRRPDGGWRLALDDGTSVDAEHVWSTVPLAALAGMADPPPAPRALEAAAALRHRAMVLLYLVLDRPQWTEYDAHYFPGPEVFASRLSEPRNYRDNPDDPADRTVLCAEIPCWPGDDVWRSADADLAVRLGHELVAARAAAGRARSRWPAAASRTSTPSTAPGSPTISRPWNAGRPRSDWSPSAARACSPPTTPTTPSPWAGRRPRRFASTARSTMPHGRRRGDGFRSFVVED